jgi:hypothetical protein
VYSCTHAPLHIRILIVQGCYESPTATFLYITACWWGAQLTVRTFTPRQARYDPALSGLYLPMHVCNTNLPLLHCTHPGVKLHLHAVEALV